MAKLETIPKITAEVTVRLTEGEVRALDALAGYGTDAFLGVFYKHMGESYLKPHEAGLRSLFALTGLLSATVIGPANAARDAFSTALKKAAPPRPPEGGPEGG